MPARLAAGPRAHGALRRPHQRSCASPLATPARRGQRNRRPLHHRQLVLRPSRTQNARPPWSAPPENALFAPGARGPLIAPELPA